MKAVLCPVCNGSGVLCSGACGCHGCGGLGWVAVPEDSIPDGTGDYWKVNWCQTPTILKIVAEVDKLRE